MVWLLVGYDCEPDGHGLRFVPRVNTIVFGSPLSTYHCGRVGAPKPPG